MIALQTCRVEASRLCEDALGYLRLITFREPVADTLAMFRCVAPLSPEATHAPQCAGRCVSRVSASVSLCE